MEVVIMAKIKAYMQSDKVSLSALSKVGFLTKEHLKELGMSERRLNNFLKNDYIAKKQYFNTDTRKHEYCYSLTKEGKNFYDQREQTRHHYYQSQSPQHDLALADKYMSLNQLSRDSWRTEADIRQDFKDRLDQLHIQDPSQARQIEQDYQNRTISAVDAVYTNEQGITVAYEVVTGSYGQAEIKAKIEFATVMGLTYESIKV